MKLYLSGWSRDVIGISNIILDWARMETRKRITGEDLEKDYDEFIERLDEVEEYFENGEAFRKAREEASNEKRPKLIARNPRYPGMFSNLSHMSEAFGFLEPEKRRFSDKYFVAGRCTVKIGKKAKELEGKKSINPKFQEDLERKLSQYPEYEGVIEIPNDRTPAETKSTVFHEGLHYVIFRYQARTGRSFVEALSPGEKISERERYIRENVFHEQAVEIMTDKLLTHDRNALFANRLVHYSINSEIGERIGALTGFASMGIGAASVFVSPYFLPFIFAPAFFHGYFKNRHMESKREELTKPVEYPKFKI